MEKATEFSSWEKVKTGQDRQKRKLHQPAAEPVTVSVQSLHQHHTSTPSPLPDWDGGTSGSHNGDYLQPQ